MTDDEAYARWQSKGDVTLNVILRCSKCETLVEGQSYSDEIERVMMPPLPEAVTPFLCEGCHRESAKDHPGQADSNGPLPH